MSECGWPFFHAVMAVIVFVVSMIASCWYWDYKALPYPERAEVALLSFLMSAFIAVTWFLVIPCAMILTFGVWLRGLTEAMK